MSEEFLNGRVVLHPGDCCEVLEQLEECSIDACACDPPYHLTSIVKRFSVMGPNDKKLTMGRVNPFQRTAVGFMQKKWDGGDVAFRPETWAAVYRVLKPGAHLVAMGGTRTYHRMACAIEDAGFEVRDTISWLYSQGFPKSHDVSKGIDRRKDWSLVEQLASEIKRAREETGLSLKQIGEETLLATDGQYGAWYHRGGHMFFETGRSLPSRPEWDQLHRILPIREEFLGVYDAAERDVIGQYETDMGGLGGQRLGSFGGAITAPATDAARQWEGWHTALKPACELIVLARKPLSEGTVAANVLRWGCGAINVDGCRVEGKLEGDPLRFQKTNGGWASDAYGNQVVRNEGRWPANVVHDGSDEVLAAFPDVHGAGSAREGSENPRASAHNMFGVSQNTGDMHRFGDSGSAARFFFQAKQDDPCHSINSASDAEQTFDLQSDHVVSALSNAVAQITGRLALSQASYRAQNTTVSERQLRIVCENVIEAMQRLERRCLLGLEQESITVRLGPVICVATQKPTGITTIILSLWKSARSAEVATFDIIETSAEVGVQGSAKRFHYTSKADSDDRLGSRHPTVKPLDLMQWLVRLITPPKGIVLDPFAGTGTTGEAAWREGMRAVLIEAEPEYQTDICRRMALALAGPDERARESIKARNLPRDEGPLFGGLDQLPPLEEPAAEYNGDDDFARSYEECLHEIRERVAAGGPAWKPIAPQVTDNGPLFAWAQEPTS